MKRESKVGFFDTHNIDSTWCLVVKYEGVLTSLLGYETNSKNLTITYNLKDVNAIRMLKRLGMHIVLLRDESLRNERQSMVTELNKLTSTVNTYYGYTCDKNECVECKTRSLEEIISQYAALYKDKCMFVGWSSEDSIVASRLHPALLTVSTNDAPYDWVMNADIVLETDSGCGVMDEILYHILQNENREPV